MSTNVKFSFWTADGDRSQPGTTTRSTLQVCTSWTMQHFGKGFDLVSTGQLYIGLWNDY
jgi:hypothetical protein